MARIKINEHHRITRLPARARARWQARHRRGDGALAPALPHVGSGVARRAGAVPASRRSLLNPLRIEEYTEAERYVLRAELPGVEPAEDVELSVEDGILILRVERHELRREGLRSEFRYGSLRRGVRLPRGADGEAAKATYANGILEVSVPLRGAHKATPSRISVNRL